jgi:excisionase family DNA binding protein
MTARALTIAETPRAPRPSAKVKAVAGILDCDDSTVRRLVRDGQLEAHRTGKRGIRVYLDSIATYQTAREVMPCPRNGREIRAKSAQVSRSQTTTSMAMLRHLGLVT